MTDYDSIWRTQDEIRTVVNAVLGECIWNLSYNESRVAIELELTVRLDDDAIDNLCCQFPVLFYCRFASCEARLRYYQIVFSTRHSAKFGEYFFVFMAASKYNRVGD